MNKSTNQENDQLRILNPRTGARINVKPLFNLLSTIDPAGVEDQGFRQIGTMLGENVIRCLNEAWYSADGSDQRNQNMFYLLYLLKDVFMEMDE